MSYNSRYGSYFYFSGNSPTAKITSEGGGATLRVYRSGSTSRGENLYYTTSGYGYPSATRYQDYTTGSSVYFAPGQRYGYITINAIDDRLVEGTEKLSVLLTDSSNYYSTVSRSSQTVTIYDNDRPYTTYPTPVYGSANVNSGVQNIGGVVQNSNNTTTNINSGNTINSNNTTNITETNISIVQNNVDNRRYLGNGQDILTGQKDVNVGMGGGDDLMQIIGGVNNFVNGNTGNDTLNIAGGSGRYLGGKGQDRLNVTGANTGTQVNGNLGVDVVTGSVANVVYRGGSDNDILRVSAGTVYGDRGQDTFQAVAGAGVAVIKDYTSGQDVIRGLAGGLFTNTAQGLVYGVGSDQMLLLAGITDASQVTLI